MSHPMNTPNSIHAYTYMQQSIHAHTDRGIFQVGDTGELLIHPIVPHLKLANPRTMYIHCSYRSTLQINLHDKRMTHCNTCSDIGLENVTQLLDGLQILQHCQVLHVNADFEFTCLSG